MRNAENIIDQVADLLLFMIAIVFMISLLRMTYQYYYTVYGYVMPDVLYQESDQDIEDIGIVSEREIISLCIANKLEYDLKIDDLTISKDGFFPYLFNFSSIRKGMYEKLYIRNSTGEIQMIQFRRISDG